MNYKPTSLQQKWIELQQIVSEQGSETKEKRAVMQYLREDLGFKDTRSSKISDRTPDGRHVRIYLWRDTPMGTIALTTGPNIVPEIHFMVHGNVAAEYINHQPTTKLLIPSAGQRPTLFAIPVPQRLIKAYHSQSMGDAAIEQRPSFPSQSKVKTKRKNPSVYTSPKDSLLNKVQSSIRYRNVRKNPQYDNLKKMVVKDLLKLTQENLQKTYGNIGDYATDYGFANIETSLVLSKYFKMPVLMNCIEDETGQMQVSWGGKGLDKHRIFMLYTTNGNELQIALGRPLETPDTYNIIMILDGQKRDFESGIEQVRKAWDMRDQLPNTDMVVEDTIPTLDTEDQEQLDKAIEDDVVTEQYATDNPEQPISDPVDPIVNMAAEIEEKAKSEDSQAIEEPVSTRQGTIPLITWSSDQAEHPAYLSFFNTDKSFVGDKPLFISVGREPSTRAISEDLNRLTGQEKPIRFELIIHSRNQNADIYPTPISGSFVFDLRDDNFIKKVYNIPIELLEKYGLYRVFDAYRLIGLNGAKIESLEILEDILIRENGKEKTDTMLQSYAKKMSRYADISVERGWDEDRYLNLIEPLFKKYFEGPYRIYAVVPNLHNADLKSTGVETRNKKTLEFIKNWKKALIEQLLSSDYAKEIEPVETPSQAIEEPVSDTAVIDEQIENLLNNKDLKSLNFMRRTYESYIKKNMYDKRAHRDHKKIMDAIERLERAEIVDVEEVSGFIKREDLNIDMFKSKDILEIKWSGYNDESKTFIVTRVTSPSGYYKKVNLKLYKDGKVKKGGVAFALVAFNTYDEPTFAIGDLAVYNFKVKLLGNLNTGMVAQAETEPEPKPEQFARALNINGKIVTISQEIKAYTYEKQRDVLFKYFESETIKTMLFNAQTAEFLNAAINNYFYNNEVKASGKTFVERITRFSENESVGFRLVPTILSSGWQRKAMPTDELIQLLAFIRCLGFQVVNVTKTGDQVGYIQPEDYNIAKVINSLVNDPEGSREKIDEYGLYFLPMENNYVKPVKISVDWSEEAAQYGSKMAEFAEETLETTIDMPEPVETPSQAIEEPVSDTIVIDVEETKQGLTIIEIPAFSKDEKTLVEAKLESVYNSLTKREFSVSRKKIQEYIEFVTDGRLKAQAFDGTAKRLGVMQTIKTVYSPVADSLTLEDTVDILAKIRCAGFETIPMNVAMKIDFARAAFVRNDGVFDGRHYLSKLTLIPVEFLKYFDLIQAHMGFAVDVESFFTKPFVNVNLVEAIRKASEYTLVGTYALKVDWTAEAAQYGKEALEAAVESVAEEPVIEPEPVIEEVIEEPVIEKPKAVLKVDERYYNSILSATSLNYQQRLSLPAGSLVMLRKVANGRLFIRFTEVESTGDTTIASSSDDVVLFRYGHDMNDVYHLLRKLFPQYSREWIQQNAIGHDFDLGEYAAPVKEEAYSERRRRRRRRGASAPTQVSDSVGIGSTLTVLNAGSFLQNIPDNVYLTRDSDVLAILPNGNYVKFNRVGILDKGRISEQVLIDFDGALIAGQAAQSDIEKVYNGSVSPSVMMRKFR